MTLCVACACETKVVDTRMDIRGWRWRRRVCLTCSMRFNTYEMPEDLLTFDEPDTAPEEDAEEP